MSTSAIDRRTIGVGSVRREYARALSYVLRAASLANPARELKTWHVLVFLSLHIPLGFAMRSIPQLATVHAGGTFLIGLWCAIYDRRRERVAYVAAYIVGSEVLWRMNEALVFWEFGKYGTAAILIVAMLRDRRFKPSWLPVIYFAFLIPSTYLTLMGPDLDKARRQLSFNLSGGFALMVCCVYFSQQVITREQVNRLFVAAIGPILGIAFLALMHAYTEANLTFTSGSNLALSGGYGPNQVSSVLGAGGLLAFFLVISSKIQLGTRIIMLFCCAFLFLQSLTTFSRSGPYLGVGCLLVASFYLFRDRVSRKKLLLGIAMLGLAAAFALPRLNAFTGGALAERYEDSSSTNRDLLAQADLQIWMANPIFGVGPGGSYLLHAITFQKQAAHTEYSRLVAEHGLFGLVAMILLLIIPLRNFKRAKTPESKALVAAFSCWALAYLLVNAMRLAAPSFFLGLTCASFVFHGGLTPAIKHYLALLIRRRGRRLAPLGHQV